MNLDEALEFVRSSNANVWKQLLDEMSLTQKRRNLKSANNFSIETTYSEGPDPGMSRIGEIFKSAKGRVKMVVPSEKSVSLNAFHARQHDQPFDGGEVMLRKRR